MNTKTEAAIAGVMCESKPQRKALHRAVSMGGALVRRENI